MGLFNTLKKEKWRGTLTLGITTFERRFETYFVPLVEQIRGMDVEIEIVVAVNGEHQHRFSEQYRTALLSFSAGQPNLFPIVFPQFRGLAKLWNSIIVNASHDHILILNDDVAIPKGNFLEKVRQALARSQGKSFTINGSWSHFVVSREEIDQVGYFDERLLGIGEEDGDMTWRYIALYGRPIKNYSISGISNFSEDTMSEQPANIACHSSGKYSQFNRSFVYQSKYQEDPTGIKGMFDVPMSNNDPGPQQYPHERFYRDNRNKL